MRGWMSPWQRRFGYVVLVLALIGIASGVVLLVTGTGAYLVIGAIYVMWNSVWFGRTLALLLEDHRG